jgi:hypothetical protein
MGETLQVLRLWLLGLVWSYGTWVVLALALGGGVLLFARLDRIAEAVERGPILDGWRGIPGILRNRAFLAACVDAMKLVLVGALALTGVAMAAFQGFVAGQLEAEPVDLAELPSLEIGLDFLLLGAVVVFAVTVVGGVMTWRTLRSRAEAWVAAPAGRPVPLLVRLYLRPRLAGVLLLVLGGYLLFGAMMQVFYLVVLVLPLPRWLLEISVSGATWLAIAVLTVLWLGVVLVMAAPFARLRLRALHFWLRELAENRIALACLRVSVAVGVLLLGFYLDVWLLQALGTRFFPDWFR